MRVMMDANVLLRSSVVGMPMHAEADLSIRKLRLDGDDLCVVPQNLYEFWVVATRPVSANGLGLGIAETETHLARIKYAFSLLDDIPTILPEWEKLVVQHAVAGKPAHDARLVAAMNVHGVADLLTFNLQDFRRYPHINLIDPAAP